MASDWVGQEMVHNGFGINALPLVSVVTGEKDHHFFFHLVSKVSQAPQAKRLSASAGRQVKESIVAKSKCSSSTSNGSAMSSFTVIAESAGAASTLSMPLFDFF
jgi:hypothetical protein